MSFYFMLEYSLFWFLLSFECFIFNTEETVLGGALQENHIRYSCLHTFLFKPCGLSGGSLATIRNGKEDSFEVRIYPTDIPDLCGLQVVLIVG